MTDNNHPMTPPLELLKYWEDQHFEEGENYDVMLIQAYQAGADQELEACCEWLKDTAHVGIDFELINARRPKPLSLKKVAYDALDTYIYGNPDPKDKERTYNAIRRALESLPD
jgi:hypothetical protein